MVSGNQAEALRKAEEDLRRSPNDPTLKTAVAVKREQLNASLRKHGQKEVR